jgi:nicotinamidase-related amidase
MGVTAGDVLVVVDMQEAFAGPTPWRVPDLAAMAEPMRRLATAFGPDRTVLTRYLPPRALHGSWRPFFDRWATMRDRRLEVWDLVPEVRGLGHVIDKTAYSAYTNRAFAPLLRRLGARRIVVCGAETDACVLTLVQDAVDRGMPVVVLTDLVTSADRACHEAALTIWRRMPEQVALVDSTRYLEGRSAG